MPTSSTAAPGFTMSAVMRPGTPVAAITMSARRTWLGKIDRAGVAQGDGGVLAAAGEEQPDRTPDRHAAADDDNIGAVDRDVVAAHQLDTRARGARQRARLHEHQATEIARVQPVGVLARIHPLEHGELVEASRQRQLDDVAGAARVGVEFVDDGLDLSLRDGRRKLALDARDPDLRAIAVLAGDIRGARRVVADEDRAEPRHHASDHAAPQRGSSGRP